jgi:hypothetical protein
MMHTFELLGFDSSCMTKCGGEHAHLSETDVKRRSSQKLRVPSLFAKIAESIVRRKKGQKNRLIIGNPQNYTIVFKGNGFYIFFQQIRTHFLRYSTWNFLRVLIISPRCEKMTFFSHFKWQQF